MAATSLAIMGVPFARKVFTGKGAQAQTKELAKKAWSSN
eukprot:CAMPEP_0180124396 /NCGR_PEP_ID=MMETSP0986-20121125/4626_1 /TAXON_ID=697907 /ORGANISM="non described non described, Strain CCMP2293" /LENGTH=38 /DNA_ID= /DNA_START= /DNA_END= /DNA_ORIENTATION=